MNPWVVGKFGVERCGEHIPLLDQDGQTFGTPKYAHSLTYAADDRSANENHFDRIAAQFGAFACPDRAIDLPSVGVALDGDIEQAEVLLGRRQNVCGQQNRSGARAKDGFACRREIADACSHAFKLKELEHRGAFTTRHDEAVDPLKLLGMSDKTGGNADALKHLGVQRKVPLHGENPH
jgi:hypothetical protein